MTALYALPAWLLLVVALVVAIGLAVGGKIAVHRRFRNVDFLQHNEVGGFIIAVVGALYAVMLAFIVSIVWQEYDGSATRSAAEAADGATAWHVAAGLPTADAARTRASLVRFAHLMIDDEWPAMKAGGSSPQAETIVANLLHDLATFVPANAGQANVQAQALQNVEAMHNARHQRLEDNGTGLSLFQWSILLFGAIVVVGFCYLFGLSNPAMHSIMTACVASLIVAAFVLIYELDYPFHGDLGITPEPWRVFLRSIGAG